MTSEDLSHRLQKAANLMAERLDTIFADLHTIAPHLRDLVEKTAGQGPRRQDLEELHPILHRVIVRHKEIIDGAGIAFGENVLVDAPSWLDWWRVDSEGGLQFAAHIFNPKSVRYYDYTAMTWFQEPAAGGQAAAVGPYIDSGGTDMNIVTLGVPVTAGGGSPSVVAADISLSALGSIFLRTVVASQKEILLVNSAGRVIASNTAHHVPGTLLLSPSQEPFQDMFAQLVPVQSIEPRRIPWFLGVLAER